MTVNPIIFLHYWCYDDYNKRPYFAMFLSTYIDHSMFPYPKANHVQNTNCGPQKTNPNINMFHGNEKDCALSSRPCLELVQKQKTCK